MKKWGKANNSKAKKSLVGSENDLFLLYSLNPGKDNPNTMMIPKYKMISRDYQRNDNNIV